MESYPSDYAAHNLPLIVLSGLGSPEADQSTSVAFPYNTDEGTKIRSQTRIPPITGPRAEKLLREFLSADGSDLPWNDRSRGGRGAALPLRIKAMGREYSLPPRKARPPTEAELSAADLASSQSSPWVLHSPVSPLTSSSPLYPDGVMTPAWLAKHQHRVPAAFVAFYPFSTDVASTGDNDHQLFNEIAALKSGLQDYKIRCVVVLLSEVPAQQIVDLEERLANLRRTTGLDSKNSLFFFAPTGSVVELTTFAQSTLTSLQPVCVEYYRDLTKHARRKKGRGTVPAPTIPPTRGTSQSLSAFGWGVRYDFKLGVFAEFRQEMDSASRHYSIALDELLGPEGIFETLPSWSPRWNDTRLLADTIALRLIRCLLWNNLPSSAVQAWTQHKVRTQQLLERKGKGTSSYGWEAWLSRWTAIMAELILKADLPIFYIVEPTPADGGVPGRENVLYAPPEKLIPVGERLPPWQYLHHAGYWFGLAAEHAAKRKILAQEVPDEDRTPPGQSPAAKVANRYDTYDTYLVPPPHEEAPLGNIAGYDHCSDIEGLLNKAISQYFARGQHRYVDQLNLKLGRQLLEVRRYSEALGVLKPLHEGIVWRKEQWWSLASDVAWALNDCAIKCEDAALVLATEWDLLHEVSLGRLDRPHDFMRCLDESTAENEHTAKASLHLNAEQSRSCVEVAFAFSRLEGNVGEPTAAQIALHSKCRKGSKTIVLANVTVQLRGSLETVSLKHAKSARAEGANDRNSTTQITLQEASSRGGSGGQTLASWTGEADLTLHAGQTKIFSFPLYFRDAGHVSVTDTRLSIETERFSFSYSTEYDEDSQHSFSWWLQGAKGLKTKQQSKATSTSIHVLPKPPKIELSLLNFQPQYYTDEPLILDIEMINKEDEEAQLVLDVRVLGIDDETLQFSWLPINESAPTDLETDLPGHKIGEFARGETRNQRIQLQTPADPSTFAIEIKALYHLVSDLETPISKIHTADLVFVTPFEASYDFNPRLHPDPWPSYFDAEHAGKEADAEAVLGITQTWLLRARIASFASSDLIMEEVSLLTAAIQGSTTCETFPEPAATLESTIAPKELQHRQFRIDTRKTSLEERRASALELNLQIRWRRPSTASPSSPAPSAAVGNTTTTSTTPSITTTLPIPRLHIPSSEPRVLASLSPSLFLPSNTPSTSSSTSTIIPTQPCPLPTIPLTYTLENPTLHFLTFTVTMNTPSSVPTGEAAPVPQSSVMKTPATNFAFAGPKMTVVNLLPMSRRRVVFCVMPLAIGAGGDGKGDGQGWVNPELEVRDMYFKKVLKVLVCDDGEGRIWSAARGVGMRF